MAVNFFESQAQARSNTFKLVWLFALAVISLIILTDLLVMMVLGGVNNSPDGVIRLEWPIFAAVSLGVCAVVLTGSLYKTLSLSSGGKAVAEELAAQLIPQNTDDLKLRKVLNVVEEMAIASGTPVPPVYLLENEPGINAFAAGFTPRDAIIGITRGAVDHLTRDQLQGVIAHEFSHIFNGDMKLNIRLMGVLSGIEIIGMAGYYLLRSMDSSVSSRSDKKDGAQLFILAIGLMVIGFTGAFFAGLIKAAVSRQREFLADASAVQYTRNPESIGGALKRIGGLAYGSVVENPRAAEVSHAFFAQGISGFMQSLSATHPPLEERILKIDPQWNGEYDTVDILDEAQVDDSAAQQASEYRSGIAQKAATVMAGTGMAEVANAIEQIGKTKPETVDYARSLIAELPVAVNEAAREPYGAIALMYTLLLDRGQEVRFRQFVHLQQHAHPGACTLMHQLLADMDSLDIKYRLPIIDLAIPALKQLSLEQYQVFKSNLAALIEMDEKVNMLEWSVQKIVSAHLDAQFFKLAQTAMHLYDTGQVSKEIELTLSVLAHAGHEEQSEVAKAFAAAVNILGLSGLKLREKSDIQLAELDQAMANLENLKPLTKPQLLKACAACVLHDQHISVVEVELLRAFADVLGCPMPLIVS
jgi:Zn-dependent protease with chaperone function